VQISKTFAKLSTLAFECSAHPYKENIVKFAGRTRIGQHPEVISAFAKSAAPEAVPPPS
jgi:hypothetical protein